MATTSIGAPGVVFPDGTTQASASPGTVVTTIYTSPAPWTKPASLKAVRVTLVGGGGGGAGGKGAAGAPITPVSGGGGGGYGQAYFQAPAIPGPLTVTVGTGGAGGSGPNTPNQRFPGTPGGSSSFGALVTTTGGTGGSAGQIAGGTTTTSPTNIGAKGGYSTGPVFGNGGVGGLSWSVALSTDNQAGQLYGGGGGSVGTATGPAPTTPSTPGQAGAAGMVIVEEFY